MAFSDNWRERKTQGGALLPVIVAEIAEPVELAPGTLVGLVPGTTVDLAAGAEVDVIDRAGRDLGGVRLIDENGNIYGVKHVDNKPRVSSMPYLFDIAEGNVPGHEAIHRYGHNGDVGNSWETVHEASTLRHYLAAAERLQLASTDADDDGAPLGNGARTVMVTGLDGSYEPLAETVTMDGLNNVTTVASFLRVLQLNTVTAGATGYNEGTITASNFADTVVLDQMGPQENESHSAAYTVPNGYVAYVAQAMATEASNKGSEFGFWLRPSGGLWTMKRTVVLLESAFSPLMTLPMRISARTDFEIRARGILAGSHVTAGFDGWIELP